MTQASEKEIRNTILSFLTDALSEKFDTDVMDVSASKLTMPVVDKDGNEGFAIINVSIARGTRENGTFVPYDGYAAHEEYELVKADKANNEARRKEKAERAEKEKERKRAARKVIKKLNEVGIDNLMKGEE